MNMIKIYIKSNSPISLLKCSEKMPSHWLKSYFDTTRPKSGNCSLPPDLHSLAAPESVLLRAETCDILQPEERGRDQLEERHPLAFSLLVHRCRTSCCSVVLYLHVLTKSEQQLDRFLNFATEKELGKFSIVVRIYFGLQIPCDCLLRNLQRLSLILHHLTL